MRPTTADSPPRQQHSPTARAVTFLVVCVVVAATVWVSTFCAGAAVHGVARQFSRGWDSVA